MCSYLKLLTVNENPKLYHYYTFSIQWSKKKRTTFLSITRKRAHFLIQKIRPTFATTKKKQIHITTAVHLHAEAELWVTIALSPLFIDSTIHPCPVNRCWWMCDLQCRRSVNRVIFTFHFWCSFFGTGVKLSDLQPCALWLFFLRSLCQID